MRRSPTDEALCRTPGTHQPPSFAYGQLARAAVQVDALRVAGHSQPSLMVASCLTGSRITSYVLDPPGDDELWSGADDDLDELLRASPDDQDWRPRPAPPGDARALEVPADGAPPATDTEVPPAEELPPGAPDVFDIPAERRGWFAQILTRAVAATTLLFAGDNAAARGYATPRQRGEPSAPAQPALFEPDLPWTSSTAQTLRLRNGLRARAPATTRRYPGAGTGGLPGWRATCTGISRRVGSARTCGRRRRCRPAASGFARSAGTHASAGWSACRARACADEAPRRT